MNYNELTNRIGGLEIEMGRTDENYDAQSYERDSEEHATLSNRRDALVASVCEGIPSGCFVVEGFDRKIIASANSFVSAHFIRDRLNHGSVFFDYHKGG